MPPTLAERSAEGAKRRSLGEPPKAGQGAETFSSLVLARRSTVDGQCQSGMGCCPIGQRSPSAPAAPRSKTYCSAQEQIPLGVDVSTGVETVLPTVGIVRYAARVIHVNTELLSLLAGTVVPLLVGLLTKLKASDAVKAILNALLTTIGGAVATAAGAGGSIAWQTWFLNIGLTWFASIATYYGFYKPVGVAQKIAGRTPNFGIGREVVDAKTTEVTA